MAIGLYGPEYLQFEDGGPASEVRVFIFLPDTKTKAVLYQDKNGQYTAPNPIWTDRRGELVFYAEAGSYDLFYQDAGVDYTTDISIGEENAGADEFVHHQTVANALWVIDHNMNCKPCVIAEDSAGQDIVWPAVRYPDQNTVELRWGYATSGTATLRR